MWFFLCVAFIWTPLFRDDTHPAQASYSIDENLYHTSYESGMLEDPMVSPPPEMFKMTVDPLKVRCVFFLVGLGSRACGVGLQLRLALQVHLRLSVFVYCSPLSAGRHGTGNQVGSFLLETKHHRKRDVITRYWNHRGIYRPTAEVMRAPTSRVQGELFL